MTSLGLVRIFAAATALIACGTDPQIIMLAAILFVYGEAALASRRALRLRIEGLEEQLECLHCATDEASAADRSPVNLRHQLQLHSNSVVAKEL